MYVYYTVPPREVGIAKDQGLAMVARVFFYTEKARIKTLPTMGLV